MGQKPTVVSWSRSCKGLRSRRKTKDLPWRIRTLAQEGGRALKLRALSKAATALKRDLHESNVLCNATAACEVTHNATDSAHGMVLRVCLPNSDSVRRSLLCEPWGEAWQQRGVPLADLPSGGCFTFNVSEIARWWGLARHLPPWLTATDPGLGDALARKPHQIGQRHMKHNHSVRFTQLMRVMEMRAAAAAGASTSTGQRNLSCAVVGSGHSLRCGNARGAEIDAHDLVYRSNAAQHWEIGSDAEVSRRYERNASRLTWLQRFLVTHRTHVRRAGARTDYRVNCLFGSRSMSRRESCLVSRPWFRQPWGSEGFANMRHGCCDAVPLRSRYTTAWLERVHHEGGPVFRFAAPFGTQEPSLEALQHSSGGNALLAAVALCSRVRLYGAGLYAREPGAPKRYAHFYDESGVGECGGHKAPPSPELMQIMHRRRRVTQAWLVDRIRGEIFLSLLHVLGVLQWR